MKTRVRPFQIQIQTHGVSCENIHATVVQLIGGKVKLIPQLSHLSLLLYYCRYNVPFIIARLQRDPARLLSALHRLNPSGFRTPAGTRRPCLITWQGYLEKTMSCNRNDTHAHARTRTQSETDTARESVMLNALSFLVINYFNIIAQNWKDNR